MTLAALNCGKRAGTPEGFESILGVLGLHLPSWDVAYLAELDAHGEERCLDSQCGHLIRRHYPGLGSWAMAFFIRSIVKHLVRNILVRGRCMAVHLAQRTAGTSNFSHCLSLACIIRTGMHRLILWLMLRI